MLECQLIYKPGLLHDEPGIPVARTNDPEVLRIVGTRILKEAEENLQIWKEADPGVACLQQAELKRLKDVLNFVLPTQMKMIPRIVRITDPEDNEPQKKMK